MKLETKIFKNTPTKPKSHQGPKNTAANSKNASSSQSETDKTSKDKRPSNCVAWHGNDEIYFISDGHQLSKWSSATLNPEEVLKLPDNFIATDLHWLLMDSHSDDGKSGGSLLITSQDGHFMVLNKCLGMERKISAHNLSINSGRWSPDGKGLLTAGEDGVLKIWSHLGKLRSTVIQSDEPIGCARWAPDSKSVVFCQGEHISVKSLAPNSKLIRWSAHDESVLSLGWSSRSNIIASGGEDCRFKIWDSQGNNLFTSSNKENKITAVAFNPQKDILLIGSLNMLKMCSTAGWTYSTTHFKDPIVGSLRALSWSSDGTQVACGTSSGQLVMGYIVQKQLISRNLKATTTGRKSLRLDDTNNRSHDILEFTESIIDFDLGYGHLIVTTSNRLHIYNEKVNVNDKDDEEEIFPCDKPFTMFLGEDIANLSKAGLIGKYINTPIIIDKRPDVRAIQLEKKYFMVLDKTSIWVYTYSGKLHLNPRFPGSESQIPLLNCHNISLGLDTLVARDNSDTKALHIFDLTLGTNRNNEPFTMKTKTAIIEIAVCRAGTPDDQFVAIIDINRDLYITETRNLKSKKERSSIQKTTEEIYKIGNQVTTIKWASESNILVGVHDSSYSIWYCPGEGAKDPTIIALTTVTIDAADCGKHITIDSFDDSIVVFCCSGVQVPISVNMLCDILHRNLSQSQWEDSFSLCRLNHNAYLWAILAAVAKRQKRREISEEAYSAALDVDKVTYLQHLNTLDHSSPEYMANNSMMLDRLNEATTALIGNGKYSEAAYLALRLHNWHKALEMSQKHGPDLLNIILEQRKEYLGSLKRDEWDDLFKKFVFKPNINKIIDF